MANQKQNEQAVVSLDQLPAKALTEQFRAKFAQIYNANSRSGYGDKQAELQAFLFTNRIEEDEKLAACTGLSKAVCFVTAAALGLSFETGQYQEVYLIPRSKKVDGKWVKILTIAPSPDGEKKIRINNGVIKHADKVVIVYEGDKFRKWETDQGIQIEYEYNPSHNSEKVIASFVRITRPDGSIQYAAFDKADFDRWKYYSAKQNGKFDKATGKWTKKNWDTQKYEASTFDDVANELYTSYHGGIDPGFLEAKTLRHALKAFPRGGKPVRSEFMSSEEHETVDIDAEILASASQEDQHGHEEQEAQYAEEVPPAEGQPEGPQETGAF